jgi:hypothetical protein
MCFMSDNAHEFCRATVPGGQYGIGAPDRAGAALHAGMDKPARHHWGGSAVRSVHVYTSHAVKHAPPAAMCNTRSEPHVAQSEAKRMHRGGLACTLGCLWPNVPQRVGSMWQPCTSRAAIRPDTCAQGQPMSKFGGKRHAQHSSTQRAY